MEKIDLTLINWRCFSNQKFSVPMESQIICDQNGSGKTTLISALYSLLTGDAWPKTKYKDSVRAKTEYFGITTKNKNWFINGKYSASGRLVTKYTKQDEIKNIKTLTYLPNDNNWFFESRTKKLQILDTLLIQIYDKEYQKTLKKLSKLVQTKQKLIKHVFETQRPADSALVKTITENIAQESEKIWDIRVKFLQNLEQSLPKFNKWINSPLKSWTTRWEITDYNGNRYFQKIDKKEYQNRPKLLDWQKLWQKELKIGKVMFGAQRDDLKIISEHNEIQEVLSRGEMRTFILFIKNLARKLLKDYQIVWLLDDIFNELDDTREHTIFEKILKETDIFIATGTKKPSFNKEVKINNLKDLMI